MTDGKDMRRAFLKLTRAASSGSLCRGTRMKDDSMRSAPSSKWAWVEPMEGSAHILPGVIR